MRSQTALINQLRAILLERGIIVPQGRRKLEVELAELLDGAGTAFARGRDLAAWLGLVPRQVTTGGRPKLLGISKRGNVYLRVLLIHGARAALPSLRQSATPLGEWLRGL